MWTLLLAAVLGLPAHATPRAGPHVRAESTAARSLIDEAAGLPTIATLMDRLDISDQFVYVEFTDSPAIPTARTKLVTATPTVRFLRIDINIHVVPGDRLPLLGHELRHAVELADAPEVRDDDGVRRLYKRIGTISGIDQFETAAARNVERQVRREMAAHACGDHRS